MVISFEAEAYIDTTYYKHVNILEDKDYYNQIGTFIPCVAKVVKFSKWSDDFLNNKYCNIVEMS